MITRTEAERIALSIHVIRQDWPVASLTTLIERDLAHWPLLDAYVALAYVAIDRAGDRWVSDTPGRVLHDGPWRRVGLADPDTARAAEKAAREREARLAAITARNGAIARCGMCDTNGYLPTGPLCDHETETAAAGRRGAARARAALAAALHPSDTPPAAGDGEDDR